MRYKYWKKILLAFFMLVYLYGKLMSTHKFSIIQQTDILQYHYINFSNRYVFYKFYRFIFIMIINKLFQMGIRRILFGVKMYLHSLFQNKIHLIHTNTLLIYESGKILHASDVWIMVW